MTGAVTPDFINTYLSDFVKVEIGLGARQMATGYTATETITKDALATAMLNAANKKRPSFFML